MTLVRRFLSIPVVIICLVFQGCDPLSPARGEEVSEAGGFVCGPFVSRHKDIPPHFINWSPDGTQLIFDDDTSVRVVDVKGTQLRLIVDANPGYRIP